MAKAHKFTRELITSSWAIVELKQAQIDDLVAIKILRSGFSLSRFGRLKKDEAFQPTPSERQVMSRYAGSFTQSIVRARIRIKGLNASPFVLHSRVARYGLETGDAMNASVAISNRCQFLITNDGDFERKRTIGKMRIVFPDAFLNEAKANKWVV